jgi:hypothetical protein
LVGGLSDAEGPKKGGRESLKESHASMVRGCVPQRALDGDAAAVSRDAPWEGRGGNESRANSRGRNQRSPERGEEHLIVQAEMWLAASDARD